MFPVAPLRRLFFGQRPGLQWALQPGALLRRESDPIRYPGSETPAPWRPPPRG
jgi:hypothetical protein